MSINSPDSVLQTSFGGIGGSPPPIQWSFMEVLLSCPGLKSPLSLRPPAVSCVGVVVPELEGVLDSVRIGRMGIIGCGSTR